MNLELFQLLDKVDESVTVVSFLVLLANLFLVRKLTSVTMATIAFLVVQACSLALADFLIFDVAAINKDVARVLFYFTFAFIDIAAVVLLYKLHVRLSIEFSHCAKFMIRMLQFLAILQVLRFLDRQWGPDVLGAIYTYGIPSINFALCLVLIFFSIKQMKAEKGFSGIKGV